jgi:hypothetical protein
MRFECLAGGVPVGSCELERVDPSMGVVGGRFEPYPSYATIKSIVRESRDTSQAHLALSVRQSDKADIPHSGPIKILDYSEELEEIQIEVMGIPHPLYDELFP